MTNLSVNFSFLADITPDLDLLHCFAQQAEMYLHLDPNTCLIKSRQFGELLAQEIAVRNGESIDPGESQELLLRRLSMNGILRQRSSNLFHNIRKDGNEAIHYGLRDYDRALQRLKDAHQLACWFYNTHRDECELNTFILPLDPAIEWQKNAQILDTTKAVNQELADKLAEKELELNELSTVGKKGKAENNRQLSEIKELKQLLEKELIEKDEISILLKEIERQAAQMTPTQKQSTIIRSHQQEEKIMSVIKLGALEIGTVLRDRYEILSQLGAGSFGITYIAKDRESPSRKSCVIKQFNQINIAGSDMKSAREGFDREAKFLEQLNHDCIPTLYSQFEEKGRFYIVQSLVDGVTLSQELKAGEKKDEQYIKELLINILTPLEYVHKQGIIHRDLKPANLIRRNDGKISLIDFGAVKELVNQPTSRAGTTIGTPGYMAPEQAIGQAKLSSDVYAVGKIAIQAATGVYPYELEIDSTGNPVWQYLAPEISLELKEVLTKMVKHNFPDRPSTSETLKNLDGSVTEDNSSTKNGVFIFIAIAIALVGITSLTFLSKKQPTLTPQIASNSPNISNLETNKLTIGVLGDSDRYIELKTYLDKTFGNRVQIQFDGSSKTNYQTLKDNIARQKLDIVFTLSPMISIAAKDNGYTWVAKMFADKPSFYKSVLFVKADSPIQSLKDLQPKTIIALGDFNSASSFYMPSYTLYGKQLIVDRGNRGSKIKDLVKSGKADVGAAAYPDAIDDRNSEFRIIDRSRDIPGAGVYLSPKLSMQDRQILKDVLLNAPQSAIDPKKANYGAGQEPDYTQFREIVNRVESILTCANWEQKSISFYCPEKETGLAGKVMSALPSSVNSNQADLELKISDRQIYTVIIPLPLINQIPGGGSLLNLKNKRIRLVDVQPSKGTDGKLKIKIDRVSQINILE